VLLEGGFNVNLQDHSGQTALHSAAGFGREKVIDHLLLQQADAEIRDFDGRTALHYAAGHGELEIFNKLLSVCKGGLKVMDNDERTALHFAAARGHHKVVQKLLVEGANVNAIDKTGRTALHLAAGYGSYQVVQLLLKKGADFKLMTKDEKELTALHVAVKGIQRRGQYEDVISILLDKMSPIIYGDLGCRKDPCRCDSGERRKLVCDALRKAYGNTKS